jgi:predicted DNA-binding protein
MKQTGVRIPESILLRVEKVCEETGSTVSSFIRAAVNDRLMAEEQKLAEHKKVTEK